MKNGTVKPHVAEGWLDGVRHVCFDKDGTLINVHRYWAHTLRLRARAIRQCYGLQEACEAGLVEAMGVDPRTEQIRVGGPVGYAPRPVVVAHTQRALAGQGITVSAEELQVLFGQVDQHQQETQDYAVDVLPGVPRFLRFLKEHGYRLSIYTSDRREHVVRLLRRVSLGEYFAEVIGGGCVRRPKPDPEGFVLACARVGVDPAQSVYISDTRDDMTMGLAGGACRVIGVTSGLGTAQELSACTPYVCGSLAEAA